MLGLFKGSGKKGKKGKASAEADDDDLPFAHDDGPDEVPAGLDDAPPPARKGGGGLLGGLLGGKDKGKAGGGKAAGKDGKKPKKGKGAPEPDPFDNPAVLALIASEVSSLPPPSDVPDDEVAAPAPVIDIDEARHSRPGVSLGGDVPVGGEPSFDDDDLPPGLDDFDEEPPAKRSGRTLVVGAVAAVVLLGAVGGGAWWMLGGGGLPGGPEETEAAAEDPAAPRSGKTISMAMPTAATPPQSLDPQAGGDGRSLSRRPWLGDAGSPPAGAAGGPVEQAKTDPAPASGADKPPAGQGDAAAQPAPPPVPAATTANGEAAPDAATAAAPPPPPAEPAPDKAPTSLTPEQRLADAPRDTLPPLKEPLFPAEPAEQHVVPAFSRLAVPKEAPVALAKAPVPAVARTTAQGVLPFIGPQGETAWRAYARPFKGLAGAPRIAVVVTGLGLDPEATDAAITRLPPDVTLSFSPYAPKLADQVAKARAAGHEVMLDLPLEGEDFPNNDPGPVGMLSVLPQVENITRLETIMGRAVGYTGFVGSPGAKFGGSRAHMRTVLEQMAQRGLMYVHTGPGVGLGAAEGLAVPTLQAVIDVDARPFREAIDARLAWLEEVARARSSTIAVVSPLPVTFERLTRWIGDLGRKGLTLAPASAVVAAPSDKS
ncbi:divergent polysaccharide deacetylase family protein [Novispirillum sp. DQ9]|uniref:divergent polysaccharide deacetylase family protein n=1 Tax=Novispirillum sp. DQ9 TaxID=3398612 RepID=UPI003C7B34EC